MFFNCSSVVTFWQRVMKKINDSLVAVVNLTPSLCLLNSLKGNDRIDKKQAKWLKVALTIAKRVILKHWAEGNNPRAVNGTNSD